MSEAIKTGLWKKDGNNGSYYSGKIEVAGQEYWVNLYKNDRKTTDSHPDLNLQLKPKENSNRQAAATSRAAVSPVLDGFEDSEIPF